MSEMWGVNFKKSDWISITKFLFTVEGPELVQTDVATKKIVVTSEKSAEELLEVLKKTGKNVTYDGDA